MSIAMPHLVLSKIQVDFSGFWHFPAFKFCLCFDSPFSFQETNAPLLYLTTINLSFFNCRSAKMTVCLLTLKRRASFSWTKRSHFFNVPERLIFFSLL